MDVMSGFTELKIILSAPMMNIEVGGGLIGSMLDLVSTDGDASYTGSGVYYTGSVSRYLSSKLAVFVKGSMVQQSIQKIEVT